MRRFCMSHVNVVLALLGIIFASSPHASGANLVVDAGYDLLTTLPGTNFAGFDFMGVPLNTFDFGGSIGTKNVSSTDTIIQRLSNASAPAGGSDTINQQLVALQLQSTGQIDFGGAGLDNYFITLQSTHGGTASTGTSTINFDPAATAINQFGTFSSSIDVYFDVHKGSLTGTIVYSNDLVLTSTGNHWTYLAPTNALKIDDVNNKLNGSNVFNDFWPAAVGGGGVPIIDEVHFSGAHHFVTPTTVPEPASFALIGFGGVCMAAFGLIRRRQNAGGV